MAFEGESFGRGHDDGLRQLLLEWRKLAADPIWKDEEQQDCSWWYGERASVSQLAGAAWSLRGWAMQDFAWQRQRPRSYAQIDLCVEHRKLGLRFIAETKEIWPRLNQPDALAKAVDRAFKATAGELERVKPDDWERMMFVFVAPWISVRRTMDEVPTDSTITDFVSTFADIDGAVVWTFPRWARMCRLPSREHWTYYPGVALIARVL